MRAKLSAMRGCIIIGLLAVSLAGCGLGGGPEVITLEFAGRDCELYAVDEDWLVYAWSPPVPLSRPIHLVARNLSSGVETELEPNWYAPGPDVDDGLLVYVKPVRGSEDVDLVAYDLLARTSETIVRGRVSSPRISRGTVVWQTLNDAGTKVIAIASVRGGAVRIIEDANRPENASDTSPRISGDDLVFLRRNLSSREFSFVYHNMSAGTTETLPIASPSPFAFDMSEGSFVYMKNGDQAFYLMDLNTREEKHLVDVPRRIEGPVMRGNIVAWTTHMRAEDFKGIAGQPLIDERDFRSLHTLNVDTGRSITPITDQFMLRRVRISDDRRIYALAPREITASPDAITDILRF